MIRLINTALAQNITVPSTPGQAAGTAVQAEGIVPACATKFGGAETLDCALQMFINVADIVLGIVGAVFLAVLVYGGILYLTSAGDSGKVQKSTKMLLSSLAGLFIVFGAFAGVTYGVQIIRGGDESSRALSEYVTCGTPAAPGTTPVATEATGGEEAQPTTGPINEGQACGPGFICRQGVCVDLQEALTN